MRERAEKSETLALHVVTYDSPSQFDFSIYIKPQNARAEFAKELVECFAERYDIRVHDLDDEYLERIRKNIEDELRYIASDFPKLAERYDISESMKITNIKVLCAFTASKDSYDYTCALLEIEYVK